MFLSMVIALLLAIAVALTPTVQIVVVKLRYYVHGILFMARCNDLPLACSKPNFFLIKTTANYVNDKRTLRVIFIRHGQSTWNSLFNSFDLGWPRRMVIALCAEIRLFFTNPFDSVIIDSPLSERGKREAKDLASFLRVSRAVLPSDPTVSVVVTSNLRRAMETALIGLFSRLDATKERVVVDSSLQEGSRNVDAQTFSIEKGKLAPMRIGALESPDKLGFAFDPRFNDGGKEVQCNVYDRMDRFILHALGATDDGGYTPAATGTRGNADLAEIIIVGHSGFFRNFFLRFLPRDSTHVAKRRKMENCAMVAFNLTHQKSNGEVTIDESSIRVLYRGFK